MPVHRYRAMWTSLAFRALFLACIITAYQFHYFSSRYISKSRIKSPQFARFATRRHSGTHDDFNRASAVLPPRRVIKDGLLLGYNYGKLGASTPNSRLFPASSVRLCALDSAGAADGREQRSDSDAADSTDTEGRKAIEYIPNPGLSMAGKAGFVITSRSDEKDVNLRKLAIFIFRHTAEGSSGFIADRESFFRLRETMGEAPALEPFRDNMLYLGNPEGNSDDSMAMMFHRRSDLGPSCRYVGGGVYCGGIGRARALVKELKADAKEFKFIYGQMNWANNSLSDELTAGRWSAFHVPPGLVVGREDADTGDEELSLWHQCQRVLNSL